MRFPSEVRRSRVGGSKIPFCLNPKVKIEDEGRKGAEKRVAARVTEDNPFRSQLDWEEKLQLAKAGDGRAFSFGSEVT